MSKTKNVPVKLTETESRSISALKRMNSYLREVYEGVKELLTEAHLESIDRHISIADKILDIEREEKLYGNNAVLTLASALRLEESQLRRAVLVRRKVDDAFLDSIKNRNKTQMEENGPQVTWSHLVTIAHLDDNHFRRLIDIVYDRGLSVRDLRDLISEGSKRSEQALESLPRGLISAGNNISSRSESLISVLDKYAEMFDKNSASRVFTDPQCRANIQTTAKHLRRMADRALEIADGLLENCRSMEEAQSSSGLQSSPDPNKKRRPVA